MGVPPPPKYRTEFYTQFLDHFNFEAVPTTYQQRYLIADEYWGKGPKYPNGCRGPVFFYTGNEAPVTDYYTASGLFTQVLAPKYGGLLVFAEHRYFGESMPFGNSSFDKGKIGFCSTDQALADYATLLTDLLASLNATSCPVIAFGGSYGGMLTAWFRMKYPNIVMGGLAASAPFAFYDTGVSPYIFTETATATFGAAKERCDSTLASALKLMNSLSRTQAGRDRIAKSFKLCNVSTSSPLSLAGAQAVIGWVESGLVGMAMLDYPYSTDYGISLPGWPVNKTCERLLSGIDDPVDAIAYAIGTFYNNTGAWQCYDVNKDVPDWGTCCGWAYLACSDTYMPYGQAGLFLPSAYSLADDIAACRSEFQVQLRPLWPKAHWGGFSSFYAGSNIIFSNGLLDPWHTSGVLHNVSDTVVAIVIPESAHHFDLRGPHPDDPVFVQHAREQEDRIIGGWIHDYFYV
eukprot:TRINITY_DN977_c0_g1_i1.p1 TRINITY_DN977_c0_g1~~TRINITY_DN977_c0_g1_i1.p1  ORF type:complete len:531 (+),score=76.80 TRINITY_DN977_c0_g1_i1:216-1595(+)